MTKQNSKIFYIHLRFWNEDGTPYNRGGTTIAWQEETDEDRKRYKVAYSLCHPNDNYNKTIGRNIVTGRLQSGDYHVVSPPFDIDDPFTYIVNWVNNYVVYWNSNPPQQQEASDVGTESQTDSNHTTH